MLMHTRRTPPAGIRSITDTPTLAACSYNASETCITVTVTYPYSAHPVVPTIPLLRRLARALDADLTINLTPHGNAA